MDSRDWLHQTSDSDVIRRELGAGGKPRVFDSGAATFIAPRSWRGAMSAVPLLFAASGALAARADAQAPSAGSTYRLYMRFPSLVRGGTVGAHWLPDGSTFWYADSSARGAPRVFFVDAARNVQRVVDDAATRTRPGAARSERQIAPALRFVPAAGYRDRAGPEVASPDGRRVATIHLNDVWLRSSADSSLRRLTSDGAARNEWVSGGFPSSSMSWSPDSRHLAVVRLDSRDVAERPVVHWLTPRETVEFKPFVNDPLPTPALYIIDVHTGSATLVAQGDASMRHLMPLGWVRDNLLYVQADSAVRTVALMAASSDGRSRAILTESHQRGVLGARFYDDCGALLRPLAGRSQILWLSERSGSRQLYLYTVDGRLVRRVTDGVSPFVRVVAIDSLRGFVYYLAHGNSARPYDTQLFRVTMCGGRPVLLTSETGQHEPRFSPAFDFFLDTHSALDRAPRTELRRSNGTFIRTVSRADIGDLLAAGWRAPEPFTAKAADGATDLWGVLYRPNDFDPTKRYPVVEIIYGGALFSEVQHAFFGRHFGLADFHGEHAQALAQLGGIVFMVDARGTPERGRDFQEVPRGQDRATVVMADHNAVLQQLGRRFPFMDLERVGLFGHSAGAFYTIRAMLTRPDFYKAGIAVSGGSELTAHLAGPDRATEAASNLPLVNALRGKLLVVHGTSDLNDPFANAMRLADAFARAGKRFELVVLPEQAHFFGGYAVEYTREAIRQHLVRELLH